MIDNGVSRALKWRGVLHKQDELVGDDIKYKSNPVKFKGAICTITLFHNTNNDKLNKKYHYEMSSINDYSNFLPSRKKKRSIIIWISTSSQWSFFLFFWWYNYPAENNTGPALHYTGPK